MTDKPTPTPPPEQTAAERATARLPPIGSGPPGSARPTAVAPAAPAASATLSTSATATGAAPAADRADHLVHH